MPSSPRRTAVWGVVPVLLLGGLLLNPSPAFAANTCFGKAATIVGTAGADKITGTAAADVIYAGDGNDTVHGGGGSDLICGGNGDDALYGDTGSNKLDGGTGNDNLIGGVTMVGGAGVYDTALFADLPATTPITASLTTGRVTAAGITHTLSGIEGLVGTPGNDSLTGSAGIDLLFGAGGNDVVDGAGGFDYAGFLVSAVNANLATGKSTGEGSDTLRNIEGLLASYSPSTLTGNGANNVLMGASGADILHGAAGDDLIAGGTGSDSIFGDAGNDRLLGQGGDDHVTGGDGYDAAAYYTAASGVSVNLAINRSSGIDGVDVLATVENLIGSNYNDTLTGNGSSNWLAGLKGNDRLIGNAGNDLLEGGAGSDSGDGGTGTDACRSMVTPASCETILADTTPGAAAAVASQALDVASAASTTSAITGYLDRTAYPITCDNVFGAKVHVTPPQIYTISGLQEAVTWTPYLYRWNGAAWQFVVAGATLSQTAFNANGSGNAGLFMFGYGTMQNGFDITLSGYYQVADYVVWTQYANTTDYEWAGTHIFDSFDSLFGSSAYNTWCYFPPAGAAAGTARQAAPPTHSATPPQLPRGV